MDIKRATPFSTQPRLKLDGDKHSKAEPSSLLQKHFEPRNFVHLRLNIVSDGSSIAQERALHAVRSPSRSPWLLAFMNIKIFLQREGFDMPLVNCFGQASREEASASIFNFLAWKNSRDLQQCSLAVCGLMASESCSHALSLMAVACLPSMSSLPLEMPTTAEDSQPIPERRKKSTIVAVPDFKSLDVDF
ncbi:hypothetical protein H112_03618 [Trichophyton rubrum D6]|uniref:Uncharacterized protein n=3 Tax=Trichophyton TaxID=5550 RepID=A0A080WNH7_TRIRC|nr:uncharacterized protein TERG_12214 [Trichophyton rubrum CBS 118892]EZF23753.1 hypothetical protein H100_03624 [Trichophyton rubrum MR850]EZF42793.1 hypothetical protein H102_03617 [Trichophyton rubrum CBS 100081]EZF53437.1 hypothetical protein H103_03627 [Trichophyton rubrum CBS 288.86]EZF64047.1 hypothetical protein H104_03613 [Trichophyton rubrum CBS 289.86]EZF74666.1 hypothetical protein H105_03641 [Trichophyton soudanense CBS 452.61]EZF85342.1 hypothetical protein H110_03626 [Trichophy